MEVISPLCSTTGVHVLKNRKDLDTCITKVSGRGALALPGYANYHPLAPGPTHPIPSLGRDRGHPFPNPGRPLPPGPGFHPTIPSSGPGVEPLPRYLTSAKVASTVCGSSGRTSCRNGRSPYAIISVFDPLTFSRTNRRWLFSFASKLNILRNRNLNVFSDNQPPANWRSWVLFRKI